jgi:EAL domain-containing protein (putative c-di-GMP-specific phosphodiesterase class I)/FixJ family two-component response regulator
MALRGATVAIVDDTLENLELLHRILEREGYSVKRYPSALQALVTIAEDPPDLILSDVYMPDMDGFDFCCHLKADPRTQAIPLLFISAFDDMGSKLRGFEVGGLDYITKPFQTLEVLARVRTHLALYGFQKQIQSERDRAEQRTRLLQQELCAQLGNDGQLLFDLSAAIANRAFTLWYQPIVDLGSQRVVAWEALLRWQHPQRGYVSPVDFIPLAEALGEIETLGDWVIEEASRQLAIWHRKYPAAQSVAVGVNVSSRQLNNRLIESVEKALTGHDLPATALKLELTESSVMSDVGAAQVVLRELHDRGLQIHIDDFGTGYSSLARLQLLPVNAVKIDRSFLQQENWQIANLIVLLAKTLNLKTIAEGIETPEQLRNLRAIGCEYGQGYLLGRPLPPAQIGTLLASLV